MRSLQNIDVAFLCINQPFTMTVTAAASATMAFKPGIVFPYHFRNSDSSLSDLAQYQALVTDDAIDIRVREWY